MGRKPGGLIGTEKSNARSRPKAGFLRLPGMHANPGVHATVAVALRSRARAGQGRCRCHGSPRALLHLAGGKDPQSGLISCIVDQGCGLVSPRLSMRLAGAVPHGLHRLIRLEGGGNPRGCGGRVGRVFAQECDSKETILAVCGAAFRYVRRQAYPCRADHEKFVWLRRAVRAPEFNPAERHTAVIVSRLHLDASKKCDD